MSSDPERKTERERQNHKNITIIHIAIVKLDVYYVDSMLCVVRCGFHVN